MSSESTETKVKPAKAAAEEIKAKVKEDSLTFPKVAATTLTAVSMAIITTQLTSVLNGLALAALVAVASALVSEIYRIFFAVSSVAANAIAPSKAKNASGASPGKTESDKGMIETAPDKPEASESRFSKYLRNRPYMRFALLFSAVLALTISASFLTTKLMEQPIINQHFPTRVQSAEIPEDERQRLINEAVEESNNSGRPQVIEAPAENDETEDPAPDSQDDTGQELEDLRRLLEEQSERIDELENQPDPEPAPAPTPTEAPSPPENTPDNGEIDELIEIIEGLENRIEELENNQGEGGQPVQEERTTEPPTSAPIESESPEPPEDTTGDSSSASSTRPTRAEEPFTPQDEAGEDE